MIYEKNKLYELRINNAIKNFKDRGFDAHYFKNSDDAKNYFFSNINKNDLIGYGGSKSLDQLGIIEKLREDGYKLLDRNKKDISAEEKDEITHNCFNADIYLASSNAVSVKGELINIDLWANRIGAMAYGPKKVILFIGGNKLCINREEAISRVKNTACVMNTIRFNKETPCTKVGFCCDCNHPDKLCATISIISKSAPNNRIALYFINEDLGF